MSEEGKSPVAARWSKFLSRLSPEVQAHLTRPVELSLAAEDTSEMDRLKARLTPIEREALAEQRVQAQDEWPLEGPSPKPLLLVVPDGEDPVLRIFRDWQALAEFMHQLEGQDVHVFPILGIPVPYTKAPNRALFLPDDTALQVDAQMTPRDFENTDPDLQNDYFLGPPELTIAPTPLDEREARKKRNAPPPDDFPEDKEDGDEDTPQGAEL